MCVWIIGLVLEVDMDNLGTIIFSKQWNIVVRHTLESKLELPFGNDGRASHARKRLCLSSHEHQTYKLCYNVGMVL